MSKTNNKILVIYYSKTGLTKKIALKISQELKTDLDEIVDQKNRVGMINYVTAGKDAMKGNLTTIKHSLDPKDYDVIIIGGPVWAWTMTPAIRTYLDKNRDVLKIKKLAFFATQGSSGADKKFIAMQEILEKEPLVTLIINGKDYQTYKFESKTEIFIEEIKSKIKY